MATTKKTQKAAQTITKSTLDDITDETTQIFEGVFSAWARKVPSKDDPKTLVNRFKMVCTKTLKNGEKVDLACWISEGQAEHFGITNGWRGLCKVAYTGVSLIAPKGQYNEERGFDNAVLLGIA